MLLHPSPPYTVPNKISRPSHIGSFNIDHIAFCGGIVATDGIAGMYDQSKERTDKVMKEAAVGITLPPALGFPLQMGLQEGDHSKVNGGDPTALYASNASSSILLATSLPCCCIQ